MAIKPAPQPVKKAAKLTAKISGEKNVSLRGANSVHYLQYNLTEVYVSSIQTS
jgi:hypothetical protein